MKRWAICALQLVGLVASAATAGTLQVTVPTHASPYPAAPPVPTLLAATLDLKPLTEGQWSLNLTDPELVLAPLQISVTPQAGWVGSSMTFDVPYFATKSGQLVLAAAVINDDVNSPAISDFLRDASATTSVEDLVLLNARARRLWDARRQTLGQFSAGQPDARVVFWLLQTEATLVAQTHLQLDQSVRTAMSWMDKAINDPSQSHLFAPGGVKMSDAKAVLGQLNAREDQLYSLVLNRLSRDVGSADEAAEADACRRSGALTRFYGAIRDGTAQGYVGWQQHETVALKNVAFCTAHRNNKTVRGGEALTEEERQAGAAVSSNLADLAKQLSRSGGSASVVHEALGRAADLKASVGSPMSN